MKGMEKQKQTIYLETSAVSAYFDFKKQDPLRKAVTREFWSSVLPSYEAHIGTITILELARRILARSGSRSELKLIPYDQAYEAGFEDMRRRVPDISKIKAIIGWEPTISLNETLDEVIAQFR